jgi:hypothetical protein
MAKIEMDHSGRSSDVQALRRFAVMLCLWRLCANAACRRARACRGCARACARRNSKFLPEGVRGFFAAFLAAKFARLSFEAFKDEMEGSEEVAALCAWRKAAEAGPR